MKNQKQLSGHCIIYDDECPMCHLYTSAFVDYGFLDPDGRQAFSDAANGSHQQLDLSRSRNEIPLIDLQTGTVTYGLPSLLKILTNRWRVFGLIEKIPPLFWLINKLYRFVSFNRKVMVPGNADGKACVPDFHLGYRLLYLFLGTLIVALALRSYWQQMFPDGEALSLAIYVGIILGQLVACFPVMWKRGIENMLEYLGNQMTVMVVGVLFALPVILFSLFVDIPQMV
ncbi:MAG: DCC1-like thiol-disulfide oxidoreductase family protein, partial [Bacteroidota bacterium]